MLLRSSSTPILGSLMPSLSYSDNFKEKEGKITSLPENANRFGLHGTVSHARSLSYDASSVEDEKEVISLSNVRRVQSESDLGSLGCGSPVLANAAAAETFLQGDSLDDFNLAPLNKPWSRRLSAQKRLVPLRSVPSFSCYCNEEEEEEVEDESLESYTEGSKVESQMQEFSFEEAVGKISGEMKGLARSGNEQGMSMVSEEPLFMARGLGLGIDVMDVPTDTGGGRGISTPKGITNGGGGDGFGAGSDNNVEEYYKTMLEQNPANPLILRNYAEFLYESKRDYQKAEDYYSRAILAQPDDGEVLAKYAKLVWELHGDEERASAYFEQAVQASPADCHVLAAYASFLWNIDGEEEEEEEEQEHSSLYCRPSGSGYGTVGSAATTVA